MSSASIRRVVTVFWIAFTLTVLLTPAAAQQPGAFASPRWTAESVSSSHTPSIAGATAESGSGGQAEAARPCLSASLSQLESDASRYGRGLRRLPRNTTSRSNLRWEVPVASATVALIEGVDSHVSNQVKSGSFNTASDNASNVVLGAAAGAVALNYLYGCMKRREHARRAGFAALEAAGYGIGADLVLKAIFNREYPDKLNGDGRFWHGGKSFPSGHAATGWALASAIAHAYPNNRWVKWGAYGAATSVSVLRLTARKHFPSDIVIGGTLGYVTGSYIGER